MNQLTFTVWLAVTLNILVVPTLFVTGEGGENAVIDGAPAAAAGVTVTFALPVTVLFVAVIIAVPAELAVNVVVAIPLAFVNAFTGITFPTAVLLLAKVILTPGIGILF